MHHHDERRHRIGLLQPAKRVRGRGAVASRENAADAARVKQFDRCIDSAAIADEPDVHHAQQGTLRGGVDNRFAPDTAMEALSNPASRNVASSCAAIRKSSSTIKDISAHSGPTAIPIVSFGALLSSMVSGRAAHSDRDHAWSCGASCHCRALLRLGCDDQTCVKKSRSPTGADKSHSAGRP